MVNQKIGDLRLKPTNGNPMAIFTEIVSTESHVIIKPHGVLTIAPVATTGFAKAMT